MSLRLNNGTQPQIEVSAISDHSGKKTPPLLIIRAMQKSAEQEKWVEVCTIPLDDLLAMVFYALTNTELVPNDPRINFLRSLREMKIFKRTDSEFLVTNSDPVTNKLCDWSKASGLIMASGISPDELVKRLCSI